MGLSMDIFVFLNTIVYFDVHTVNQRLIEEMGESFLLRDIGARLSLIGHFSRTGFHCAF